MNKKEIFKTIPYFLLGMMINATSFFILGIAAYFNPRTYFGDDGYNNGLVVLMIYIPIWLFLILYFRAKVNKYAILGISLNMILNVIFYTIVGLSG